MEADGEPVPVETKMWMAVCGVLVIATVLGGLGWGHKIRLDTVQQPKLKSISVELSSETPAALIQSLSKITENAEASFKTIKDTLQSTEASVKRADDVAPGGKSFAVTSFPAGNAVVPVGQWHFSGATPGTAAITSADGASSIATFSVAGPAIPAARLAGPSATINARAVQFSGDATGAALRLVPKGKRFTLGAPPTVT